MEGKKFLFKELSFKLVGICIDVQKEYGSFHRERVYHNVLEEKLAKLKIAYKSKIRINVFSKDSAKVIGYFEPDFIIDNKIILEIKASPLRLIENEIQLSEYVKTTEYEVGYLVNFGIRPLFFKRIIYTNDRKILNTNNAK